MSVHGSGRFAPSPSGDLHIGNLRTAVLAWLFARSSGRGFLLRFEDLDRVAGGAARSQLDDLAAIGLDWEPPVRHQSEHLATYERYLADLTARGLTYECFCTRREILSAPSAPHQPEGAYPGTCRSRSVEEIAQLRRTRPPALRLRTGGEHVVIRDEIVGRYGGYVDDFVLRRGDGAFAYNFVAVLDDGLAHVTQVVRGDDLLSSAPRQAYLAALLNFTPPSYAHVPLVLNAAGKRLAKRDGAVTLKQLVAQGFSISDVLLLIGESLGMSDFDTVAAMLSEFTPERLPRAPWIFVPPTPAS